MTKPHDSIKSSGPKRKVLLIELNEVTWDLIDPFIDKGLLPTFALLKNRGAWGTTEADERPPHLDPWVTWNTVYTGRPQSEHNVNFLEQPPESIHADRIWEICNQAGLSVGVFGSLCSWPPQAVKGFHVPGTFSPDPSTFPEGLRPIQILNLTYTRSIRLPSDNDSFLFRLQLATRLLRLGLRAQTALAIARQLAVEFTDSSQRWKRVALQPLVNFDFFRALYLKHRPAFATFHTNHVAHFMHTYWKAMEPWKFTQETSDQELRSYGKAVEFGYQTADELLKKVLKIIDPNTILVVASSMGQKPYISTLKDGKEINQIRSLDRVIQLMGLEGQVKALFTMSGQFNIYADRPESFELALERFRSAFVDAPDQPMFWVQVVDNSLTCTLRRYEGLTADSRCHLTNDENSTSHRFGDLVHSTGLIKSGCHDPRGVLFVYGPGIAPGLALKTCNTLDLAPTLLEFLGVPIPPQMKSVGLSDRFVSNQELVAG